MMRVFLTVLLWLVVMVVVATVARDALEINCALIRDPLLCWMVKP